jgi:type IV pilus assembly protein PilC
MLTFQKIKWQKYFAFSNNKVTRKDITVFTRQIATMLGAGISFIQALDLIKRGQHKPKLYSLFAFLKNRIENGTPIAEAFRQHPELFDKLYCGLIFAGEQSGSLDVMFDRLASYKEKSDAIQGKIKKALFYPVAVMIIAMLVSIALLLFVVPQFESLFANFSADLPLPTRIAITLSAFLQQHGGLLFFAFIIAVYTIRFFMRRNLAWINYRDQVLLKIPMIGSILVKAIIARFTRTLSTTFAAGLPIIDALRAASGAAGNYIYQRAIQKISDNITAGQTLEQSMRQTFLFPPMVIQMIAIGEESGTLESMLSKIANIYENEVDNAVDGLSTLIEPVIMLILGIIIGSLVIAMYLPVFKLGSVVG